MNLRPVFCDDKRYIDDEKNSPFEIGPVGTTIYPEECGLLTIFRQSIPVTAIPPPKQFLKVVPHQLIRGPVKTKIPKGKFFALPRNRRNPHPGLSTPDLKPENETEIILELSDEMSDQRAAAIVDALKAAHSAVDRTLQNPFRRTDGQDNIKELEKIAIAADLRTAGCWSPSKNKGITYFSALQNRQSVYTEIDDKNYPGKTIKRAIIDPEKFFYIQHEQYRRLIREAIMSLLKK